MEDWEWWPEGPDAMIVAMFDAFASNKRFRSVDNLSGGSVSALRGLREIGLIKIKFNQVILT